MRSPYGGEEFIVLEGIFQDEHGDYPAGSYIRNPPQSRHTPGSEAGCIIFVKLWQFNLQDRQGVRISPSEMAAVEDILRPGVLVTPLFEDEREEVRPETWSANTEVKIEASQGAEILVLSGIFVEGDEELVTNSWLRIPVNTQVIAKAGDRGAKVWLKTGHLPFVTVPDSEITG